MFERIIFFWSEVERIITKKQKEKLRLDQSSLKVVYIHKKIKSLTAVCAFFSPSFLLLPEKQIKINQAKVHGDENIRENFSLTL